MAVKTVRVLINGVWIALAENLTTGKFEGSIATPNITSYNVNANHYYPVVTEVTDLAGNVTIVDDTDVILGSHLKLYVKELIPPEIIFNYPSSGAYLSTNTPTLEFKLYDEVGGSGINLNTLLISIDDGASLTSSSEGVIITGSGNYYSVVCSLQTALTDGEHTVIVNIKDNDGNKATAVSRSFIVDTVPPELNIANPLENISYKNVSEFVVTGSTNDSMSSSVSVIMKLNNVSQGNISVNEGGNFSKSLNLVEGINIVEITATDLGGKCTTDSRIIIFDTVAPVIKSILITPNPINVGQTYFIEVDVEENEIITNNWLSIQQNFENWQEIKNTINSWADIKKN